LDAATFNSGTKILNIKQTPAAPPSGAGLTAKASLQAKGWIIYDDSTPDVFNFSVVMTAPSLTKTFNIQNTSVFSFSVNWGDGTINNYTGASSYDPSHTYAASGTYNVQLYSGASVPDFTTLSLATSFVNYVNWEMLPDTLILLSTSNLLTSFNPSIALPSGLQYLSLNSNQLTTFNPSIALPSGLQYLYLNSNQLTSFNPSISLPIGLTQLDLSSNLLTSFNPSIALPSGLQYLSLNSNQLTTFDPSVALPNSLQVLYLNSNQLTSFNPSNSLPIGLTQLDLSNNFLTSFNPNNALPNTLLDFTLQDNDNLVSFNPLINVFSSNVIDFFYLNGCNLNQNELNQALIYLDNNLNTYSGNLYLNSQLTGASPSAEGLIAAASLAVKGYTVYTD
jgi:PKD repeat protein